MNDQSQGSTKAPLTPDAPGADAARAVTRLPPGPGLGEDSGKKAFGESASDLRPTVRGARMKTRHWGLVVSFVAMVLVPLMVVAAYMGLVAQDQYASTAGFTVRQEGTGGATELLGGLASLTGVTGSSDSDILYEFILSQALVRTVNDKVDLRGHYGQAWPDDPVFALWPDATIEDLESYWQRIVRVSYDQSSKLMELRVLAYTPDKAQQIAREIISESQEMINALNEQARADAMRYATIDLNKAMERLKKAREAMTGFRTRTRILDPDADLQGRMGVMSNLQQQLAQALIDFDLLREQTSRGDPRQEQAQRKIAAIRDRIAQERQNFATENGGASVNGEDYPSLMAEYEGMVVDREFAEESYRAALAALDVARAKASRQSRYLSTYVSPTRAEASEYPQRLTITGLTGLFLLLAWAILALVYYSIRDRA